MHVQCKDSPLGRCWVINWCAYKPMVSHVRRFGSVCTVMGCGDGAFGHSSLFEVPCHRIIEGNRIFNLFQRVAPKEAHGA